MTVRYPSFSSRPLAALVVVIAVVTIAATGCTSSPPLPSAGTETPSPTPATPAIPATPADSQPAPASTGSGTPSETVAASQGPTTGASPVPSGLAVELVTPGTLTVCTAIVGAPATSVDQDGQLVGYNVGFAKELAARSGLAPVIQQADFGALISMVQSHSCDASVASQNITAGRTALVNLIPYTQSKAGFPVVVQFGNPKGVKKLTDLCGLTTSAAAGTTFVDQVAGTGDFLGTGLNDACAAAGKSAIHITTFPSDADAVQALLDGTVDAYLGNANFVDQFPGELARSGADLPGLQQGIAVALDHPVLTAAVHDALSAMISDGTYLQILSQYLPSQSVDNFSIVP